jgi:hypothetical protein
MVQNFDELKAFLLAFADEEPRRAALYRSQNAEERPSETGAVVLIGKAEGRTFLEIRGIEGELPANLRIEDDAVLGSSREEPDDWKELKDEDIDALRAFSLLDPRVLGASLDGADFGKGDDETIVIGHIDLGSVPGLPAEFVEFLKQYSLDHTVELHFVGRRLVEIVQQDLYPRQTDRISERFDD